MDNELYNKELEYIFNRFPSFQKVGGSAYKPGLETMGLLSSILGMPHEKFHAIHIAGTNGKGSTSHMIASALSMLEKPDGTPLKVGLYTSPHLLDFRERMKVSEVVDVAYDNSCDKCDIVSSNGKSVGIKFVMPSKEFVYDFLTGYKDDFIETGASFFEITTAMAFYWFAKEGVDIAVVECGLGGRLDATNIITPMLSVITNIGLDHCEYLGNTLEEVAGEKAGIIKPGVPVVIGERSGVAHVFEARAAECGSRILFAEDTACKCDGTGIMNGNRICDGDEIVNGNRICEDIEIMNCNRICDGLPDLFSELDVGDLDLQGDCQQKNIRGVKSVLAELFGKNILSEVCGWSDCVNGASNSLESLEKIRHGICNAAWITGLHGRWETLCEKPFVVCDTGHNAHGFAILGEQIKHASAAVSRFTGRPFGRLVMIFGVVADKDLNSIAEFLPGRKLNSYDLIEKDSVEKDSMEKDSMEKDSVEKDSMEKDSVEKDSVEKDSVEKDSMEKDSVEKDSVEKDSMEKDSVEKDSMEKDSVEKDSMEKDSMEKDSTGSGSVWNGINVVYYFVNAAGTRALSADKLRLKMKELGFEGEVIATGGENRVGTEAGVVCMEGEAGVADMDRDAGVVDTDREAVAEDVNVEAGRRGDIKETLEIYMNRLAKEDDFVFIGGSTFVVAEALEFFAL